MIIDVTGIVLVPGNEGRDCPGSWEQAGLDCCCDECDYMFCCMESHDGTQCVICNDLDCPRSANCPDKNDFIL